MRVYYSINPETFTENSLRLLFEDEKKRSYND